VAADKAQSKAIAAAQDMRQQVQSEVAKMRRRKSLEDAPGGRHNNSGNTNGSTNHSRGKGAAAADTDTTPATAVVGDPVKSEAREDADVEVTSHVYHHAKVKPLLSSSSSSSSSRPPSAPRQLRFEEETSEKLAR